MSEDYDMQKNIYGDGSLHLKEIGGDVCVFLLSYFFLCAYDLDRISL